MGTYIYVFGLRRCGVLGVCGGVMSVCVVSLLCVYVRSRYLYIVLGGYLLVLGSPSVQSFCILSISASYHINVFGRFRKSRFACV